MQTLFLLPGLIIGLTVHEAAHAITAKWLGDDVAWRQGRVTLNPLKHLSLFGTLALFVLGFGWGKPVEVNLYHFKSPKRDYLISSLAGPVSNILLSLLALGALHLSLPTWLQQLMMSLFMINAILALVNLIPIPPLDGSKIWPCIIPGMRPVVKNRMSQVWVVVLVVAMYTGAIGKVLNPSMNFLANIMYSVLNDTETFTERPEEFPASLVPPDDANNVTYTVAPAQKGTHAGYALFYDVNTPYPCDSLLTSITLSLMDQEWHKTVYLVFEPNTLASEWAPIQEPKGPRLDWTGTWVNEFNNWIYLNISYEAPEDGAAPTRANVQMFQTASEFVELYRVSHPNEIPMTRQNGNEPLFKDTLCQDP